MTQVNIGKRLGPKARATLEDRVHKNIAQLSARAHRLIHNQPHDRKSELSAMRGLSRTITTDLSALVNNTPRPRRKK